MRAFFSCFPSFWGKLILKMYLLVLGKILGVFVNTLTADGMYPLEDWENLTLSMQMQLSEKRKTFSEFFVPFLESTGNFKHFEINMMVIANEFLKLKTAENFVRPFSKNRRFGTRFDSQHVKVSRILANCPLIALL